MEKNKTKPLGTSNIPKPSRLPTRTPLSGKRTIAEVEGSNTEEGIPPSKRFAPLAKPGNTMLGTSINTTKSQKPKTKVPARAVSSQPTKNRGPPKQCVAAVKNPKQVSSKQESCDSLDQLQNKMKVLTSRMNKLEAERTEAKQGMMNQQSHQEVAEKVKFMEEQLSETKRKLSESEHNLELAEKSKASLQLAYDGIEMNLGAAQKQISDLKAAVSQVTADVSIVQCQLEAVKVIRDKVQHESLQKSVRISELEQDIDQLRAELQECRQEICENESQRRKLHNTIQELKGNIRVFCRVRPLLPGELSSTGLNDSTASADNGSQTAVKADRGNLHIEYPDKEGDCRKISIQFFPYQEDSSSKRSSRNQLYEFEYDHVFHPECSQEDVFSEVSQLVQSALDGYNVCIFAYGQTGSGKTYTMEGPSNADEHTQGMIPRALKQVFAAAQDLSDKGWTYKIEASFIEIYNETLQDLLSTAKKDVVKHEVRIDSKNQGKVYVTNITPVVISSEQQVTHLLEIAAKNRAVAATDYNERSSRSHCLFQLSLSGSNHKTMETCSGSLNLVDLAGSERLGSGVNVTNRLKETQSINKSLSNLGNVIMALANREKYIPFRNSKLTYLLQNSLGGNSKTLMFVNLSPQPMALQETLCSLRFASKVNQCHIGTARRAVKI